MLTHGIGQTLVRLSLETLAGGLQVSERNLMTGVNGRLELLRHLGSSLLSRTEIFGEHGRPGKLVGKPCSMLSILVPTIE